MKGGERLLGRRRQDNSKSGCQGVDRDKRVKISNFAVLLRVGTAMAAEVMGPCVLTEILDLVFHKSLSVHIF